MRKNSSSATRSRTRGFTLIETLTAVAVVGVVSAVTVPSMSEFVKNSALRGQAYELMSSIAVARSEATKRGSRVILCRSADPTAATPVCGGTNKDWSTGWLLFVAEDTDNDFDLGTDILIGTGKAASKQITVMSNGSGNNYLVYGPDGSLMETSTARYAFCDDRGEAHGKEIAVALVGRASLTKGTSGSPITNCAPAG